VHYCVTRKVMTKSLDHVTLHGRRVYYSHLHEWGLERRDLRYAMLGILLEVRRPIAVPTMHALLRQRYKVAKWVNQRSIADALASECLRGRVHRFGRGVYGLGDVSPSTFRRVRERVQMLNCCATKRAPVQYGLL
jgi:hypothetical protein